MICNTQIYKKLLIYPLDFCFDTSCQNVGVVLCEVGYNQLSLNMPKNDVN